MPTSTYTPEEDGWVRGGSTSSSADAVAAYGSYAGDNKGNTAYVKAGITYFCARTYYRFDTTSLSTGAVATSAFIQIQLGAARGGTTDAIEVHKLFKSSDNSSSFSASLYETITSVSSNTTTDVGNVNNSNHQFVIDGDLLDYLNEQIAAGAKPAFLLRNKGDYDVATEGNASGINTRAMDGTADSVDPFLSITYSEAVTYDAPFFGANF